MTAVQLRNAADSAHGSLCSSLLESASLLHDHLVRSHWRGSQLSGPDVGVRFNSRIWRFFKSALRGLSWRDDMVYLQAQGYWILANVTFASFPSVTDPEKYLVIAEKSANSVLSTQDPNGSWPYPNREWQGRVATAEGSWAAIGLLALYRATGDPRLLEGAEAWNRFVESSIGFQEVDGTAAVNYFAGRGDSRIPNNSAFYLRFLAELESAGGTGSKERQAALLAYLASAQLSTGEFPYESNDPQEQGSKGRTHFQCNQYNAFMALDLFRYADITGSATATDLARNALEFLRVGQRADGAAAFSCEDQHRLVTYHSAVLAAAFAAGARTGNEQFTGPAEAAYRYVLSQQRADGSFAFSRGDYRVLSDVRSYPRPQAMILEHLLQGTGLPIPEARSHP